MEGSGYKQEIYEHLTSEELASRPGPTRPGTILMPASRRQFLRHAAALGSATVAGGASAHATTSRARTFSPPELLARQATRRHESTTESVLQPGEVETYAAMYRNRRNWGRWGDDDQVGAINLITAEKRAAAAALVRTGRTVSLSRTFEPPQHFITKSSLGAGGGYVMDYLGFIYHGATVTHIDAMCHIWDEDGMWQGRNHTEEVTTQGAHFADITHWNRGIITKGVLIDVPRHRRVPHVTREDPVTGDELAAIAEAQRVSVDAGDALLVHSGWEAAVNAGANAGAGLHVSCAEFIRDHDVALLGWDLMDAGMGGAGLPWPVHGVLFNFGVALLDNARLEPIADACSEEGRHEFMFMLLPLNVARGTGSPANPVAMF